MVQKMDDTIMEEAVKEVQEELKMPVSTITAAEEKCKEI